MAVFGFLGWYRRLHPTRSAVTGRPPATPPEHGGPVRLLMGTACGSVLLFSIAVSARVAAGLGTDALAPLTTAVLGSLGAAAVTALAAVTGRALRGRMSSGGKRPLEVSDSPGPADAPPPRPGPEHGDVP
ncbi:hypothetical protein AAW14_22555 [Streptomyces hygroscopicus]|uniref:hypothetical protein n=1 Tax=Streptomyces hygroscopicus TaxID=1912 RepID=UPI002240ABEE|nr:hypothetical protein [Streptomyces hygroscopicus]MCW7944718.1 hypothetical protein [Streptomyces hygroscopicus]